MSKLSNSEFKQRFPEVFKRTFASVGEPPPEATVALVDSNDPRAQVSIDIEPGKRLVLEYAGERWLWIGDTWVSVVFDLSAGK